MSCFDPKVDIHIMPENETKYLLSESKVSSIKKHRTDNLYDIQKVWLRSFVIILPAVTLSAPVPTLAVNEEFITSSPPIIFRMKRIFISFITLYHCYCETRPAALIFYRIDVVMRKA